LIFKEFSSELLGLLRDPELGSRNAELCCSEENNYLPLALVY